MVQAARIRLMVISATTAWCYWQDVPPPGPGVQRQLHLLDLSGRPPEESLDGRGLRIVAAPERDFLFTTLLPGLIIQAVIGDARGRRFSPLARSNVAALPPDPGAPAPEPNAAASGSISYYAGLGPR